MKQLIAIDYGIIAVFILISFAIGNYYMRRAGSSLDEYFPVRQEDPLVADCRFDGGDQLLH